MVDLVSYINLDFRKDRKTHMEGMLRSCPYPTSRVSAVRLRKLPKELGITMKPGMESAAGVASIFMSHKKALENALESGVESEFVLLEDDVQINKGFWDVDIDRYFPKEGFDIVFLSPRVKLRKDKSKRVVYDKSEVIDLSTEIRTKYITGAHFLIFKNRSVIEKALKMMSECQEIYDVDVFYIRAMSCCGIFTPDVRVASLGSDHTVLDID